MGSLVAHTRPQENIHLLSLILLCQRHVAWEAQNWSLCGVQGNPQEVIRDPSPEELWVC